MPLNIEASIKNFTLDVFVGVALWSSATLVNNFQIKC